MIMVLNETPYNRWPSIDARTKSSGGQAARPLAAWSPGDGTEGITEFQIVCTICIYVHIYIRIYICTCIHICTRIDMHVVVLLYTVFKSRIHRKPTAQERVLSSATRENVHEPALRLWPSTGSRISGPEGLWPIHLEAIPCIGWLGGIGLWGSVTFWFRAGLW